MNKSPADKQVLAVAEGLAMVDGDQMLYRTLIESFITSIPFDAGHLRTLITSGRTAEAAKYLHLIKGAGRQIGAERLGDTTQLLEDIFRGKTTAEPEQIEELQTKVATEYSLVSAAIRDTLTHQ
jgi:HPt (histidine-containing phosphotransfer) domain-containing protein